MVLAQGGAKCYQNLEDEVFGCEMRYYNIVAPAQERTTREKRLIDQWFLFEGNQCDIIRGFDVNECERKRKIDTLNAELTFSLGTDAATGVYLSCMAVCAAQLAIPGWGEVAILPCAIGCSSVTSATLLKIKSDYNLEVGRIGIAKTACDEAATAKRDLCVRLKDNEAKAKKAAEDSKFAHIEGPAFRQKESCLASAKNRYDQCMARQP
jgi:hypothetical protein